MQLHGTQLEGYVIVHYLPDSSTVTRLYDDTTTVVVRVRLPPCHGHPFQHVRPWHSGRADMSMAPALDATAGFFAAVTLASTLPECMLFLLCVSFNERDSRR